MAKYALCIGINDYPGTENDLAGCVNDAKDWGRALEARGFDVATVLDAKATRAAVAESMRNAVARGKAGDAVVITYSGHGTWVADRDGDEADGRDEALCPHDVGKAGPLVDDELYDIFSARAAGLRLVFISDSCHSGTVARAYVAPGEKRRAKFLAPAAYVRSEAALRDLRRLERAPSLGKPRGSALLLSACQDSEYSYDAVFHERPNGAFTRVALDALKRLRPGATYRDWYAAIRERLPSTAYPQRPGLVGTSGQKRWPVLE